MHRDKRDIQWYHIQLHDDLKQSEEFVLWFNLQIKF